jgi:hypothetical protein
VTPLEQRIFNALAADAPLTDEVAYARIIGIGDEFRATSGARDDTTSIKQREWLTQCDVAVIVRVVANLTAAFPAIATQRGDKHLALGLLARDHARSIIAAIDWRVRVDTDLRVDTTLNRALDNLDDACLRYDAALRKNGVGPGIIAALLGFRACP